MRNQMFLSVELAASAGILRGSGTDILGPAQTGWGEELALKARMIGQMEAILIATATNARLFRMEDSIGKASEVMDADLIAASGDPISDIGIQANGKNIPLVITGGQVFKESL